MQTILSANARAPHMAALSRHALIRHAVWTLAALLCAAAAACPAIIVPRSVPSKSKLSIHLIGDYTPGAAQIVAAHPRVLKILDTGDSMLQAARDYKARTLDGKVVLRIYTPVRYSLADDPAESAQHFWNTILAPPLNALSAEDRALIDFLEGPNEGDSTPTFETAQSPAWYNQFWLTLAPLIAQAGFRPCAFSIAVGNPPGSMAEIYQTLDTLAPALRLVQSLGGAWSYHGYTLPYSQDVGQEIWYSLRYRQYYSYFQSNHPELARLPLIITEGGVDGQVGDPGPGWLGGGEEKFKSWLEWYDSQIRQDDYVIGCTLFESGAPGAWSTFEIEPVAEWLATHIGLARPESWVPYLSMLPYALNATLHRGEAAPSLDVTVQNLSGGTLDYSLASTAAWLTGLPQTGQSTGEPDLLSISTAPDSLAEGIHYAYIAASDPAASNSPLYLPVTLRVDPPLSVDPIISVSPAAIETQAVQGSDAPDTTLNVKNKGGGTLAYRLNSQAGWVHLTPEEGTSTGEEDSVAVSFPTSLLPAGRYTTAIAVTDVSGKAAAVNVPVTLDVLDVTAPQLSNLALSPGCARAGSTTGATATVVDNAGGSGVQQASILVLGPEMLTNRSFESGLTGWDNPDGFISGNTYPHPGGAKDGTKYVGSSCGYSSGTASPELRRTLSVTPGLAYLLTVWVNTAGSPNTCSAFLQWKDGAVPTGSGQCATLASFEANTSGWRQLRATVTPQTSSLTICLKLSWDCAGAGGGGNLDLASVCAAYAPATYSAATHGADWSNLPVLPGHTYPVIAWDASGNAATAELGLISTDGVPPSTTASCPASADREFDVQWTATDSGCNGRIADGSVRLYSRRAGGTWADSGLDGQSGASGSFTCKPAVYGIYDLAVVAADGLGNAMPAPSGAQARVYYHAPAVTIATAKQKADGAAVYVGNGHSAVVTAAFPGYFYAQQAEGSCGIQVQWAGAVKAGTLVELDGTMGTSADGERFIAAENVLAGSSATTPARKIVTRDLGGQSWRYDSATGAGQRATRAWQWLEQPDKSWKRELADVPGLSNIGLRLIVTATVLATNGTTIVVDDGSNLDDGDPKLPGVKVALPAGMAAPAAGSLVQILGVSSCYKANGDVRRLLRVAAPADVTVLWSPMWD